MLDELESRDPNYLHDNPIAILDKENCKIITSNKQKPKVYLLR